jgi:hypothetical protein
MLFEKTFLTVAHLESYLAFTDEDVGMMAEVFRSKQRLPIEVMNMKLVEFIRACPS